MTRPKPGSSPTSSAPAPLPMTWGAGEHVALIGQTGSGKTTLARRILSVRRWVVVVKTKLDASDPEVPVQAVSGTHRILDALKYDRVELRPKFHEQSREIYRAYQKVFEQGGWTTYNDEEWYLEQRLRLTPAIEMLLTQGRAKRITMVMGAQRPVEISRFVLSQATHVISFGCEGRDVKTLADATSPRVGVFVSALRDHEFIWWRRYDRATWVGQLVSDAPDAKFEEVDVGSRFGYGGRDVGELPRTRVAAELRAERTSG